MFKLLLMLTSYLFCHNALAETSKLVERHQFIQAEKAIWSGNDQRYEKLYKQLKNYSLRPYLKKELLMRNVRLTNTLVITHFLKKYRSTPLDWPLRKKWLYYLAKKKRQNLFLNSYRPNSDVALNCYYYRYQLQSGLPAIVVLPKVTKLWIVGKSQPKSCDPLFKRWRKAGYQTNNVVWQRIELAARGGKHTLIPYLTKLLPQNQQYLAKLWHKVRRNPAYITRLSKFPKHSKKEAEILSYGLKRLVWHDPQKAIIVYKKALKLFTFSKQQQRMIIENFALALMIKNNEKSQHWLAKVNKNDLTPALVQWKLSTALSAQNWQKTKETLIDLPKEYHQSLQWKYWYAQSLMGTNEKVKGLIILNKLATKRHYYGFLAARYLNKSINLQDDPLYFSVKEKQQLLKNPAAQRAFELFYLHRYSQARREWNYWLSQLNHKEKLIAAKIANDQGWYDRAIVTLAQQGDLDDVNLRFPQAYANEIKHYSKQNKVPPSWAFAIARRESSFMSDAQSAAGAFGLMQILPSTAKYLLRSKNISHRSLFETKQNIRLGTKYLRQLLTKQHGNFVLATASYNAGPYRVNRWLNKKHSLPADVWIETIPYQETRDYVKSVLAYQQIYQIQNKSSHFLFDKVLMMKIGG